MRDLTEFGLDALKNLYESGLDSSKVVSGICTNITPLPNPQYTLAYKVDVRSHSGKDVPVFYFGFLSPSIQTTLKSQPVSISQRYDLSHLAQVQTFDSPIFHDVQVSSEVKDFNYLQKACYFWLNQSD